MDTSIKFIKYRRCPICDGNRINIHVTKNNIDIVRCLNCFTVFADVDFNLVKGRNSLDSDTFFFYYDNEPIYTIAYYDMIINKIISQKKDHNIKLLDFGCGSGMFLRRCRRKGIDAYGIDNSKYAALAKEMFKLNIEISDLKGATFPDNYFDVIISHATFEHIYYPIDVAKKLLKLLKKDGLFITSGVPNFNASTRLIFNSYWNNMPPSHVNYFNVASIELLYRMVDIHIMKSKTYGFDIWQFLNMINPLEEKYELRSKIDKNTVFQEMKNYDDHEISLLSFIIANVYNLVRFPYMGHSIEIWGKK